MRGMDVLELVHKRKWDSLIILVLLLCITALIPLSVSHVVTKALEQGLEPTTQMLQSMDERLESLEHSHGEEIISRGIQAYKKVYTIDELESNTQNSASIQIALNHADARAILFQLDRNRTILFEDYFKASYMTVAPYEEVD